MRQIFSIIIATYFLFSFVYKATSKEVDINNEPE